MKRIPLILVITILCTSCKITKKLPITEYVDPDPSVYVNLMPVVREYFYYRKQAVISNDMNMFYQRYPDLELGADLTTGINCEANFVATMQGLRPFDGDILPEYYGKIKINQKPGETQVLIHGMELYLWQNEDQKFDQSGGEFKTILSLQPQNGCWQIFKTDEVTIAEWKDFQP